MTLTVAEIHQQLVDRETSARETFNAVFADGLPEKTTVGKHEASNHVRIKEVLAKAWRDCPDAASVICWFLWWRVLDAQLMAELSKPEIRGASDG